MKEYLKNIWIRYLSNAKWEIQGNPTPKQTTVVITNLFSRIPEHLKKDEEVMNAFGSCTRKILGMFRIEHNLDYLYTKWEIHNSNI